MLCCGWRLQMGVLGILGGCLFVSKSNSFFESITVWQGKSGQLVYGVADDHNPDRRFSMANYAHLGALLSTFDQCKKKKTFQNSLAIIEDVCGYKGSHKEVNSFIEKVREIQPQLHSDDYYASPLKDLGEKLQNLSFPFINAEHRFLRTSGLETVQEGIPVSSTGEFPTWCTVSGNEIVQEYEQAKSEIEQYTENPLLPYYRDTLQFVHTPSTAAVLDQLRTDQIDIVQFINERIPSEHRLFFANALRQFDAPLVDAHISHLLYTNPGTEKIILLLGAAHVYQIGEILKNVRGFKEVAHAGVRTPYPYEPITFDPCQADKNKATVVAQEVYALDPSEFELIGADDPERFMAQSYS